MGRWPGLPHYWILGQYRGAPGFAHTYLRTSSLALASLFLLLSLPFYSYLNGRMSQFRVVDGTYIAKSFRKRYTCKFNVAASRSRRRKTRRFNRLNRTKFITDTLLYVQVETSTDFATQNRTSTKICERDTHQNKQRDI